MGGSKLTATCIRLAQWPGGNWSSSIPGPEGFPIIFTCATKEAALAAAMQRLEAPMVALTTPAPQVSEHGQHEPPDLKLVGEEAA